MKTVDINYISQNYSLFVDAGSFLDAGGGRFIAGEIMPRLKRGGKKLKIPDNTRVNLFMEECPDSNRFASLRAHKTISELENNGVLEEVSFPRNVLPQRAFVPLLFEAWKNENVCLITENADLAQDIMLLAKNLVSSDAGYDLCCMKIGGGIPQMWSVSAPAQKAQAEPGLSLGEGFKKYYGNKLLISFVVDNSATMDGGRIEAFKRAFSRFSDKLCADGFKESIEFSLVLFEDFTPRVIKKFTDESCNFNAIRAKKLPFLDKSIHKALDGIDARYNELKAAQNEPHKPWLFILSDGQTFDDISSGVDRLKNYDKDGGLLYMPFMLSNKAVPQKLLSLDKAKRMIKIQNDRYEDFFAWATAMATKRVTTPKSKGVTFAKADFAHWTTV